MGGERGRVKRTDMMKTYKHFLTAEGEKNLPSAFHIVVFCLDKVEEVKKM